MTKSEIIRRIDEMIIGRNAMRNRKILISRLVDGLKYDELAERYELSIRQVQNVVHKWEKIILDSFI